MQKLILLAIGLLVLSSRTFALSAEEIVEKADEIRGPSGAFSFNVRVKDFEGNKLQRENIYKVYSKDMKFSLIETIFPERHTGRKLLMASGLWLYLPTLKRPTRVGMQQRLTGEVSNGDIARTNFQKDYRPRLLELERLRGEMHYKVELTARDNSVPYKKIHLYVDRASFVPRRAEFYALSGKLLKTGDYSGLKPVLGKKRLTKLVIKDALQPSKQSHLTYFNYTREKLDDSFFSKEALTD